MVRCREPILYSALRARACGHEKRGKGVREKGRWRRQNLIAVFFIKLIARKSAGKDCTQAVALLERQGPAFPAAREAVSPHGEQRVFPAPRGKRGERSALFLMLKIRWRELCRYESCPFKSLSSKPWQELGGRSEGGWVHLHVHAEMENSSLHYT